MEDRELLPCPFCGSSARAGQEMNNGWYVECTSCQGNVGKLTGTFSGEDSAYFDSQADAIAAWNRRTQMTDDEARAVLYKRGYGKQIEWDQRANEPSWACGFVTLDGDFTKEELLAILHFADQAK